MQETFGKQTVTTQDFPFRPVSVSPSAKYFPVGGSLWLPAQHHTQRLMKNSKALRMAGSFIYLPFTWAVQLADRLHSTLKWEISRGVLELVVKINMKKRLFKFSTRFSINTISPGLEKC